MAKLSTSEARQLCFIFLLLLEGSSRLGIERLILSFVSAMWVSLDKIGTRMPLVLLLNVVLSPSLLLNHPVCLIISMAYKPTNAILL